MILHICIYANINIKEYLEFRMMKKGKNAFTLAEVLITLAVIGVVAATIIPSLINNTHKTELKVGVKRAYSMVSQAVQRMVNDEGAGLRDRYLPNVNTFQPVFIKYFFNMKNCNSSSCIQSTNITQELSKEYQIYSRKSGINTTLIDEGQFVPVAGMTIFVQNSGIVDRGLLITVDVNSHLKPPNVWGQDLFTFELMGDDSVKPAGAPGTGALGFFDTGLANRQDIYCSKTSSHGYNGVGCTAKALLDDSYWENLP